MSLATLLNRPCQITHRAPSTSKNAYGAPVDDETIIETVCELQQQQRTEDTDRGAVSDTVWLLILPAGTTIGQADTVTVDSIAYEIHGGPWPARNPRTQTESHIEATLKRTSAPGDDQDGAS